MQNKLIPVNNVFWNADIDGCDLVRKLDIVELMESESRKRPIGMIHINEDEEFDAEIMNLTREE